MQTKTIHVPETFEDLQALMIMAQKPAPAGQLKIRIAMPSYLSSRVMITGEDRELVELDKNQRWDAGEFVRWLGKQAGLELQLPGEEEEEQEEEDADDEGEEEETPPRKKPPFPPSKGRR
jgi:hypothetical protein